MIKIKNYPQLKLISWNRHTDEMSEEDALFVYETNWRFIDQESLTKNEYELINSLVHEYGGNLLHV